MRHDPAPDLWTVGGCLFEVSLPLGETAGWRWVERVSEVTLLGQEVRDRRQRQHFRFRAEEAGAGAGEVELRFESGDGSTRCVVVRVAPEAMESH